MEIGVCVKRVPMVGGKIVLTPDEQEVDTRLSGFTISPHEECGVEEAVQITERLGGTVSVITLGPPAAADQLREALALGAKRAVLLETDGGEWGPIATAGAIVAEVRRHAASGPGYDLLLCGNEAADTGDYQVGIRVAYALGWPCVTGIKNLEIAQAGTGTVATGQAGVPRRGGDLRIRAARRDLRQGGHQPAALPVAARAAAGQAGGDRAARAAVAARKGCASGPCGCPRPSARRPPCWAPARTPCPRCSVCSKNGACCHDRAVPGGTRRRRGGRRVAAGAVVRPEPGPLRTRRGGLAGAAAGSAPRGRERGRPASRPCCSGPRTRFPATCWPAYGAASAHVVEPGHLAGVRAAGLGAGPRRAGRADRRVRRGRGGHRPRQRGDGLPRRAHRPADGGELRPGGARRRRHVPPRPAPLGRACCSKRPAWPARPR